MPPASPDDVTDSAPHHRRGIAHQLISRDNQAWIFRVVVVSALAALIGYFWLYADRHNDERYVRADAYKQDQENARKAAADTALSVNQLQAIRQQDHDLLTEMRNDIKWIREQQHK